MSKAPRVLVTGSTDGIGKETARILVSRGASVVVHGRDRDKAEHARREVNASEAIVADLTSLDEVRAMAARLGDVDVLINNAGVYATKRTATKDGRELTMAVNHDAPVLLTHLLLNKLKRVVMVSSIAHSRGRVDVDDIDMKRGWDGYRAYASSKLANVLFAFELARRSDVRSNAVHPGVVSTKLLRTGFNMGGPDSLADGASTQVHLALDDTDVTGKYFAGGREAIASSAAYDLDLCASFYEASCARVGVTPCESRAPG